MQTNTQVDVAADEYAGVYADDGVYGTLKHDVDEHADGPVRLGFCEQRDHERGVRPCDEEVDGALVEYVKDVPPERIELERAVEGW